jgi:hypothetical protein
VRQSRESCKNEAGASVEVLTRAHDSIRMSMILGLISPFGLDSHSSLIRMDFEDRRHPLDADALLRLAIFIFYFDHLNGRLFVPRGLLRLQ